MSTKHNCAIENQAYTKKLAPSPFINKEIQRSVMIRSKLRHKFLESRSCVTKKFWKTVKRFFSDKSINFENLSLMEKTAYR